MLRFAFKRISDTGINELISPVFVVQLWRGIMLTALAMVAAGCATHYRHPDYVFNSPEDYAGFATDNQECEPPENRRHCAPNRAKAALICTGDGRGGHVCKEAIPTDCTVETLEQCLYRKGWRRADQHGNYLEPPG